MQYLGGKFRLRKVIAGFVNDAIREKGSAFYVEPFVGGNNISALVNPTCDGWIPGVRKYLFDANLALINLYRAIQYGWVPPDEMSADQYAVLKRANDATNPLTAFAAVGCSFGGKWWGGYATNQPHNGIDYARAAKRRLTEKLATGSLFACVPFLTVDPHPSAVFYLDPPYDSTTGYAGCPPFDNRTFWVHAAYLVRKGATVLVSEYRPPPVPHTLLHVQAKNIESCLLKHRGQDTAEKLFRLLP